ncbi:MAG: hypothetical protein LBR81_06750 [Prevotellaceae bacterium]|jgi:hypothetical protein|nr:hypothetical protein [Prevotellaceae bacterium]
MKKATETSNPTEMSKKKDANFLAEFIKEDREEIRLIKNRIYTYMQVLLAASLAITAFFIKGSVEQGEMNFSSDISTITIFTNGAFLIISVVFFYFQYEDLRFVRHCLKNREKDFEEATGILYFNSNKSKKKKDEKESFRNDWLLLVPMIILVVVYLAVICWLVHHM